MLTQLADPRGAFGWHRDYADVLPGAWRDYLILETAASKISGYEAQRIPRPAADPRLRAGAGQGRPALGDDAARDRAAEAVLARQQAILNKPAAGTAPGHRAGGLAPAGRRPRGNAPAARHAGPRRRRQRRGHGAGTAVRVRRARGGGRRVAGAPAVRRGAGAGTGAPGRHRRRGVPGGPATTSTPTPRRSTNCGRSRSAPRSPPCCCAAWRATDASDAGAPAHECGGSTGVWPAGRPGPAVDEAEVCSRITSAGPPR